ncbi:MULTISPECIES: hypothetical protein [Nocardiaceae]|uniref:hypothetical protein n=1 Tax=Nocardiaceae TaxID=85025 RepID=UPI00113FD120|nr:MULTISPECIES: hypothetical protein [Rhodococcus]
MDMSDVERRLLDLERRLAAIEGGGHVISLDKTSDVSSGISARSLVHAEVRNKRFEPENPNAGIFSSYVYFDCGFTLHRSAKPTRAVKGAFEFCDIFEEPQFVVTFTMNDGLEPGKTSSSDGIGLEYNQFMPDHQWFMGTELRDMTCRFRVDKVIYRDGTSDDFV